MEKKQFTQQDYEDLLDRIEAYIGLDNIFNEGDLRNEIENKIQNPQQAGVMAAINGLMNTQTIQKTISLNIDKLQEQKNNSAPIKDYSADAITKTSRPPTTAQLLKGAIRVRENKKQTWREKGRNLREERLKDIMRRRTQTQAANFISKFYYLPINDAKKIIERRTT